MKRNSLLGVCAQLPRLRLLPYRLDQQIRALGKFAVAGGNRVSCGRAADGRCVDPKYGRGSAGVTESIWYLCRMTEDTQQRPLANIKSMAIDFVAGRAEIALRDGRLATIPYVSTSGADEADHCIVDLEMRTVTVQFPGMSPMTAEIGGGGLTDPELLKSRPVVYLDQNHWVTLAERLHRPGSIPQKLMEPADKLIDLALSQKVVLPLSSGHFIESTVTDGEYRRALAKAMLGLSRGWQMMDPLRVRRQELLDLLHAAFPARGESKPSPVITLEPDVLYFEGVPYEGASDFPPEMNDLLRRVVSTLANYSTLADPNAEQRVESQSTWVRVHEDLAAHIATLPKQSPKRDMTVKAWMLQDLRKDLAICAATLDLTQAEFLDWLESEFDDVLLQRPYVGLVLETTRHRLRDSQSRWEPNDLVDMLYLCCAAGYTDLVVGERKFTGYLNRSLRACRVSTPCVRSLSEAVQLLDGLIGVESRSGVDLMTTPRR